MLQGYHTTSFYGAATLTGHNAESLGDALKVSNKTIKNWLSGRRGVPDFAWQFLARQWLEIQSRADSYEASGQNIGMSNNPQTPTRIDVMAAGMLALETATDTLAVLPDLNA